MGEHRCVQVSPARGDAADDPRPWHRRDPTESAARLTAARRLATIELRRNPGRPQPAGTRHRHCRNCLQALIEKFEGRGIQGGPLALVSAKLREIEPYCYRLQPVRHASTATTPFQFALPLSPSCTLRGPITKHINFPQRTQPSAIPIHFYRNIEGSERAASASAAVLQAVDRTQQRANTLQNHRLRSWRQQY